MKTPAGVKSLLSGKILGKMTIKCHLNFTWTKWGLQLQLGQIRVSPIFVQMKFKPNDKTALHLHNTKPKLPPCTSASSSSFNQVCALASPVPPLLRRLPCTSSSPSIQESLCPSSLVPPLLRPTQAKSVFLHYSSTKSSTFRKAAKLPCTSSFSSAVPFAKLPCTSSSSPSFAKPLPPF